ncbi:hypothetical protein AAE478_009021 [Parahypoxylon ruwenzoriense]
MQPWSLLNSGTNFLVVLGSFNVFLGPPMGVMFADYFLLRKTTIKLTDLYGSGPQSIYWYTKGWNLRADELAVDDADYFGTFGDPPVIHGLSPVEASSVTGPLHIYEEAASKEKTWGTLRMLLD